MQYHTGMHSFHSVVQARPVQQPEPGSPQANLNHAFENPAGGSPSQPEQQYSSLPQQSAGGYSGQGYDYTAQQQQQQHGYYGNYGQYPQGQQQQQQQTEYSQQAPDYYTQPPQSQQPPPPPQLYGNEQYQYDQQQQQQQAYPYNQASPHSQMQAPPQHQQYQQYQQYQQPQHQQQYQNPDHIRYCAVEVGRSVSKGGDFDFDHPSIPRMMPSDVEADNTWCFPAPAYITPVSLRSVRPTLRVLPANAKVAEAVGLPIGITVSPFAETNVPEVDFTDVGNRVIRCRRCNAYINPFTTFADKGTKWQCILCRQLNETLREYGCSLDEKGLRRDIASRPELTHASVDLIATPEYLKSPPRRPIYLMMLDCSYIAVSTGLLREMCEGALRALESLKDDEAMRFGIVGYDTTVYFFNLRSDLSAPRVVAAPDTVNDTSNVNDAFKLDPVELPCPINDLVVPIKGSFHLLKELLETLPVMFAETKEVGCAFGPALAAAIAMLENNGGKILTSICSIPSRGQGALKHRFNPEKLSNQPKEYTMLAAANDWYKQRALACSASAVSVDIITGNVSEDMDLATIAPLARFTAGHIYPATLLTMRGISAQVERILTRFIGFDSVLRVRTSPGLVVPNFYGHCYVREPELLSLPVGTEDSSFTVEFTPGPNFKGSYAYIQFAVMYTSRNRERRIRVHTIQLPVSSLYGQIINSVNSIGMACFLSKMCVDSAVNGPFAQAQHAITNRLVAVFKAVQQHLAKQGATGGPEQLLLPESMKYIPEIISGFFRASAVGVATSRPILPDRRVAAMAAVMSSRPESMLPAYLSWTFQVHASGTAVELCPMPIYATRTSLTSRSLTLTTLSEALVLWYGKRVNPAVLHAFGLQPVDPTVPPTEDPSEPVLSQEQLDALRVRTDELTAYLCGASAPFFAIAVEVCPQGKGAHEQSMARSLVEDDYHGLLSYKAYMQDIWKRVATDKA